MKPIVIDLFCGLGGWSEAFIANGYRAIGFDIEAHDYGKPYPSQLIIQDVLTIHGRQFKDASLIVASPPCQEYSYMAMPWSRAKAIAVEYRSGKRDVKSLTALFDACFRIQREAIEAAGRFIPMVVENVRGAQPWVGKARWNFGSFYLWGDVPALMPIPGRVVKVGKTANEKGSLGLGFNWQSEKGWRESNRVKLPGNNSPRGWDEREIQRLRDAGYKNACNWWSDGEGNLSATTSSKSNARKAASAQIAKIPFPLADWIARVYKPKPYATLDTT